MISTLENDGAERAMSNITTHLPEGVEADILLNSVSAHDFPTDAHVISLGMKPDSNKGLMYQIAAILKKIPVLYKMKKSKNYDACISFMESGNICNIITGNRYCKTIVSVRVSVEQEKTWVYKAVVCPLVKLFYKKADHVAAVAEGVRLGMINFFKLNPKKVNTITNGYDIKLIRQRMLEECNQEYFGKKDQDDFIFVTTGRMTFQKAHWHLIRAFSEVAQRCKEAKLFIIGKGEEKEYLLDLIKGYGLEDRVKLLGYQKNPFAILVKCNAYIMPSMFEGYSNALCEALICGLPCIATDFQSSAREILAPDTQVTYQNMDKVEYAKYGVLTPVCSGKKYGSKDGLEKQELLLAEAMLRFAQDRALYDTYKKAASERGEQLDIDKKVEEWLSLVNK